MGCRGIIYTVLGNLDFVPQKSINFNLFFIIIIVCINFIEKSAVVVEKFEDLQ